MQPILDDFRSHIPEDVLARFGPLVQLFPKRTWDRSALSQFGVTVVGAAAAAVCLAVSFLVVVSDKPEEQLPFQQAMWGVGAVAGIFALYGLCTGISRAMVGVSGVGKWWLLCERGLVILSSGKLQHAIPLTELRAKTTMQAGSLPKLFDAGDRSLALPLHGEVALVDAVIQQQREARRHAATTPEEHAPYALAWAEAKWFGEDRVFRLYPDGSQVLVIYAGQFLPEQFGIDSASVLPMAVNLVAGIALAYSNRLVGQGFAKRAVYLDAMSLAELRIEARTNDASRILTPETTTDIHLGPAMTSIWSNDLLQARVAGRLIFKHQRKEDALNFIRRPWELAFFTPEERDFALEVFCQAFGDERVVNELANSVGGP